MIIKLAEEFYKIKINTSEEAYKILLIALKMQDEIDQDKEHMFVLGLKRNNCLKFIDIVSTGSLTGTIVHSRETYRRAIIHSCSSIICGHNHPSGNLQPSREDEIITKSLKEAGKIIDIPLVDHIIFTNESHFSFTNEGRL